MTYEEVMAKLTSVFREVFEDETIVIRPDMTANDVAKWDSLSHVDMIVSVEDAFGIRLSTRAVASMKNVGELVAAIEANLK
jgi:acyl carrier protein